jgi:hypothetical protein
MAASKALTAMSGFEPSACTPVKEAAIHSAPFSAIPIRSFVGSQKTPASIARTHSDSSKLIIPMPPCSSSAVKPSNTGFGGIVPDSSRQSAASIIATLPPFISAVPLPYMTPSTTVALSGEYVHAVSSPNATVSRCPKNPTPPELVTPGMRIISELLPELWSIRSVFTSNGEKISSI